MNASNDTTARKGLRGWWLSPPRHGLRRLLAPYEYPHPRLFGLSRIAGGVAAAVAGLICLSFSAYGWAAFFLVLGGLNLAVGCWELTIARSVSVGM